MSGTYCYTKITFTDFESLKEVFDNNKDNKFDANDAEFNKFLIWQDKNQDGVSQSYELTSLLEAGLLQIDFNTEQTIHDEFFVEDEVLLVNGVTLLFPFARQQLAEATLAGGYPPILLDMIDFRHAYLQSKQQIENKDVKAA